MIYLDNSATTAVHPLVKKAICDSMDMYGNPSSLHPLGEETKQKLNDIRKKIALYIGAQPEEIIFTSSGSEANNMALKGFYISNPDKNIRIITTPIEHKSILVSCDFLYGLGCRANKVSVDNYGRVDLVELDKLCKANYELHTELLVSVQFANNEIGTVQDIKTISEIVHKYNGVLHVDAVQAFSEIQIDVKKYGIDMMSVSGHKFGCPKGIGFLYKTKHASITSLIHGGKQENGLRAGTENIPYIIGMGKAIDLLKNHDVDEISNKRDYLIQKLSNSLDLKINGALENRLSNNINVSIKNCNGSDLIAYLNACEIFVSSGSACNSGANEPSYVLRAIGVPDDYINGTVRISLSDDITYDELDEIVKTVKRGVNFCQIV